MTYNYDDALAGAELPENSGGKVPPGDYQAVITRAVIRDQEETFDEHPQLSLYCQIVEGAHKGRMLFVNNSFNPEHIRWLKLTLTRLGLDPLPSASDILEGDAREGMLMRVVALTVAVNKKKPQYTNTYLNRLLSAEFEGDLPGSDDKEIPF